MKKVLSLVLALTLVLGMSTVAFATEALFDGTNADSLSANASVAIPDLKEGQSYILVVKNSNLTNKTNTGVKFTDLDDGTLTPAWDNVTLSAELVAIFDGITASSDILVGGSTTAQDPGATWTQAINATKVTSLGSGEIAILLTVQSGATLKSYSNNITLYDDVAANANTRNKVTIRISGKIVSDTAAASGQIPNEVKIIGVRDDAMAFPDTDYDDLVGDVSKTYELSPSHFVWQWTTDINSGVNAGVKKGDEVNHGVVLGWVANGYKLKASHLSKVTIRKTNALNNNGTIKEVKIDGINVKITTVKYFIDTATDGVSGAFDLQLAVDGKTGGLKGTINFTIKNKQTEVDGEYETAHMDDNVYVKALSASRNVEMDVGENLYITKSFGKDQKAYCRASLELSAGDEKLFTQYAELDSVYTLYHKGVTSAGVTAQFKDLGDTYFVYDDNFKLIGTTSDTKLPWSTKYYLTTKKVDLSGNASVEEPTESTSTAPQDPDNAGTGGGTVTAPSNYNPNTGR